MLRERYVTSFDGAIVGLVQTTTPQKDFDVDASRPILEMWIGPEFRWFVWVRESEIDIAELKRIVSEVFVQCQTGRNDNLWYDYPWEYIQARNDNDREEVNHISMDGNGDEAVMGESLDEDEWRVAKTSHQKRSIDVLLVLPPYLTILRRHVWLRLFISFPVISLCYSGACTFNSMVLRVYALF